jgi:predicted nucleotidyltransferase
MLTKTQVEILKVFVSKIDGRFSIKEIADKLEKHYPLIHRSVGGLLDEGVLKKDDKGFVFLNYKSENKLGEVYYAEALRKEEFLKKNKSFSIFFGDVLNSIKGDFIALVFGSSVEGNNPRDIDFLIILEDKKKIVETERVIDNLSDNFSFKLHAHVLSKESASDMLSRREEVNILNETLNKHILLFGSENYYRMLKNARK